MDQVKHFANFVTQWQEFFAAEVQGMAQGTTTSIKQLEEMAQILHQKAVEFEEKKL